MTTKKQSSPKQEKTLLHEFNEFDGVTVKVWKGHRGNKETDIDVTIKDKRVKDAKDKSLRHIYWVVDVLLKSEHDPELTCKFLKHFVDEWDKIETLKSNSFDEVNAWISKYLNTDEIDLSEYESLSRYGFMPIMVLYDVLTLLTLNERSASKDNYMFKTVIQRIAENDTDIYDIIAWADNNWGDLKRENRK